jgi:hypothetical protein
MRSVSERVRVGAEMDMPFRIALPHLVKFCELSLYSETNTAANRRPWQRSPSACQPLSGMGGTDSWHVPDNQHIEFDTGLFNIEGWYYTNSP